MIITLILFTFVCNCQQPEASDSALQRLWSWRTSKQYSSEAVYWKALLERLRGDSAITPKVVRVRVRPQIKRLSEREMICCDMCGSCNVFTFVIFAKSNSLNQGIFAGSKFQCLQAMIVSDGSQLPKCICSDLNARYLQPLATVHGDGSFSAPSPAEGSTALQIADGEY